jgi:hypothetical protein
MCFAALGPQALYTSAGWSEVSTARQGPFQLITYSLDLTKKKAK